MTVQKLLTSCPKVTKQIKEWYLEQMLGILNVAEFPEDFKKVVMDMGIDDDKIATMIQSSPRGTFEFFDEHKVVIIIDYDVDFHQFLYENKTYDKRIEAELAGVEASFKKLEEML